jgi:hypothetical protein
MSLMSEQSRQALSDAFFSAARSGLLRSQEDALEIQSVPAASDSVDAGDTVLVITTSSFAFRLLIMFRVSATPETRAYYGAGNEAGMQTAFAEIANLCCGALNRELARDFPHLGMSIPYFLSVRCMSCLDELKPDHVSHYGITVNGSVQMTATLCICCSAPVQISTRLHAAAETTGELELF